MIGRPVCFDARAAARWIFSTFGVTPGSSAAHLMKAALMSVPWMPVLDVVDEDLRDLVLGAVHERLREVVVGVHAGGEDHVEAGLVGHALAEGGVAVEEHRARLDDGPDAVALDPIRVGERGVPLGLLVVEVRELEAGGLVGRAEVLVDEREPELLEVDGAVDALDCGHCPGSLRVAGVIRARLSAGVDHHPDEDAERGHDERDDQPDHDAPSRPWMKTAPSASAIGKRIGSHFQRVGAA